MTLPAIGGFLRRVAATAATASERNGDDSPWMTGGEWHEADMDRVADHLGESLGARCVPPSYLALLASMGSLLEQVPERMTVFLDTLINEPAMIAPSPAFKDDFDEGSGRSVLLGRVGLCMSETLRGMTVLQLETVEWGLTHAGYESRIGRAKARNLLSVQCGPIGVPA